MYETEEKRKQAGKRSSLRYDKTKKGFLVNKYAGMKYRVNNKKFKYYFGLPIMTAEQFYEWSMKNKTFHELFQNWVNSDYERRLTPSVDRVVSAEGYILNNVEWVIFSKNCARANRKTVTH